MSGGAKDLAAGATLMLSGDITTLNVIWPGAEAATEAQLGFEPGRLSLGYSVALVAGALKPSDFQFGGTTMRSGGRLGLPADTTAADRARERVHDSIMEERGAAGYAALQDAVLASIPLRGPKRLAKVLPVIRNDKYAPPNVQYPMGGGALQWQLIREVPCLIAVSVSPDGIAATPDFTVDLRNGGYEARQRLRSYMQEA